MGSTHDPQPNSHVDDGDPSSESGFCEGEVSVGQACQEEGDEHVEVDYDGVFETLGLPVAEIAHCYDIVLIIAGVYTQIMFCGCKVG